MYRSIVTRDIFTIIKMPRASFVTLRVVFDANGHVTLPQMTNPCGDFGGSPSVTRRPSRPDPLDLISSPLEYFENICTAEKVEPSYI